MTGIASVLCCVRVCVLGGAIAAVDHSCWLSRKLDILFYHYHHLLISAIATEGGVVGSLVYTSVSGGLVWGSLYLSDPVRREALRRSFKERQGMSFAEVKDHTLTAVKNRTVSATNATVAAVKAKYNEIRTRISEASKKGPEK